MGYRSVASFTKIVNPRLAKRLLKTNGRLANHGLSFLVIEGTDVRGWYSSTLYSDIFIAQNYLQLLLAAIML